MFSQTVAFTIAFVLTWRFSKGATSRPNIIIIVADDLGWNDVSFHGSPQIATPNLDAMASDGLVLNNYYVQPLCTPSRAALMSGYYPIHTGLQHSVILGSSTKALPLNFTLMPQYLKKLGYVTHAIGKWHLGHYKKEYTPTFRGFDSFFGSYLAYGDYYDHTEYEGAYWGLDMHDNFEPAFNESGQYATDLLNRKALERIRYHDTSKPLFLYLAHKAVHFGNEYGRLAAPIKYTKDLPHIRSTNRRLFAGMVTSVDISTGQVFEALEEKGMLNNSIILFTTDNGGDSFGTNKGSNLQNVSSNWPLRGGKYTLFEGGIRGIGVLWSSYISSRKNSQKPFAVRNQLVHLTDWLPTLYHAAGGDVKELVNIDGLDQWESLTKNLPSPRTEILLNIDRRNREAGIRFGKYKLLQINATQNGRWFKPSGRDSLSMANLRRLPILVNTSTVAKSLRNIGRYVPIPQSNFYTRLNVTCPSRPAFKSESLYLFDVVKDPCEYYNIATEKPEVVTFLLQKIEAYNRTYKIVPSINNVIWSDPDLHGFVWTTWGDSPQFNIDALLNNESRATENIN